MPLNGVVKQTTKTDSAYQYFIQLVPTQPINSKTTYYQYAVTECENFRQESESESESDFHQEFHPGVFLIYEFTPITLITHSQRRSIFHLLTRCLAIFCGCISVAGFIDKIIFDGVNQIKKTTKSL